MDEGDRCIFTMINPKNIAILDFTYELPPEKIAVYPLAERDASKLLVYRNGSIQQGVYKNIDIFLQADSLLVFNNTKVIKARILFMKPSGGVIEIFLLEPFGTDYTSALSATDKTAWKCMIGGAAKWKGGELKRNEKGWTVAARLTEKLSDAFVVEFSWDSAELSFAEILDQCGKIPLPPYIKRAAEQSDTERYQTIYANDEGSVAAPTAGLHFTETIFKTLAAKGIQKDFVTLHVGAGTFKPVKAATMIDHEMHAEWIDVSAGMIKNLIAQENKTVVAVGTTSLRTLESLYWMGAKVHLQSSIKQLELNQWEVYEEPLSRSLLTKTQALSSLLNWMQQNNRTNLFTRSQILIAPGYSFKIANAIITNFHQPQSTLLLLVAAAIGDGLAANQSGWRKLYNYALQNEFRFLSYGDGCLLFIDQD